MSREKIRSLRKLAGLSQGALAKKARLTPSEFSRIECGYRDLSRAEAMAIAKALKVPVEQIEDTTNVVPPVVAASAPPPVAVTALAPAPPGNDLRDPANFRELPDSALLQSPDLAPDAFRKQLAGAIARANEILHTPKVSAEVWRAWREFEKRANELLRIEVDRSRVPTFAISGAEPESRSTPRVASAVFRVAGSSRIRHMQKSTNALFVEAARRILPSDVAAKLTGVAEARLHADRSHGFMRHFRDAAQELLPTVEVGRILDALRSSEARRGRV